VDKEFSISFILLRTLRCIFRTNFQKKGKKSR